MCDFDMKSNHFLRIYILITDDRLHVCFTNTCYDFIIFINFKNLEI